MRWFIAFISVFALWILLMWSVDPAAIGVGLACAALIASAALSVFPESMLRVLDLRRWFFLLIYLPYFLYYCLRANIDVALRVIHPDTPIRPGIVKVRTTLKSDMARTFLANSITLTPGTLTVDVDDADFYIHWISINTDDPKRRTAEICGRFEPLLRRIFE